MLRCVDQTRERFGRSVIIDVLRGADTERIRQFRLDELLSYGALRNLSRDAVSAVMDRLLEVEALRVEMMETRAGQFPVIRLGEYADAVLEDGARIGVLSRPQAKKKGSRKANDMPLSIDRDLFARLSALRKRIANSRGVPPYVVFPDSALRNMADRKPQTISEMGQISGVGVVKLREFGEIFLREILKYLEENSNEGGDNG